MGGSIRIRQDAAWVESHGTYDNVLGKLEQRAREIGAGELLARLERAMPPYLRHLSLRELNEEQFRLFADLVRSTHDATALSGPGGFGGHPEVFDTFMKKFDELLELTLADPRLRSPA